MILNRNIQFFLEIFVVDAVDAAHTFLSCDKEICVSFTLANPKGWNLLLVHYNKRRKQPGGLDCCFA